MDTDLPGLIEAFGGLRAAVIGDAMLDSYLHGAADRLCREAPVPIVALSSRTDAPGGAANTAANLRGLGARVTFLSVTGEDPDGDRLRRALAARDVEADHLLVSPGRRTIAKNRVLADGHMLVRFDEGSLEPVDADVEDALIDALTSIWHRCDAVVVSDYGYGVVTARILTVISELQRRMPKVLVADAKDLSAFRRIGVTAVKPNYQEAARLLGERPLDGLAPRIAQMASNGQRLLEITGARIVAITLDTAGALVFEQGAAAYRTYAKPATHARAAGAGDTFVSALTLGLAAGASTPAAAELASAAAAVVVARDGTALCSAADLREHFTASSKHVASLERIAARAEFYRNQGRRIVFTNGCFDILHRGHITYLNRAKALGDVLIVGVNSDDGVRRLKGPDRPINGVDDRVQVLAALSCIDHIVPFDEDTPARLIEAIRPDVFVKGGDYSRETLPEAPLVEALGGSVQILPFVSDRSTTGVIERVRRVYGAPSRSDGEPVVERRGGVPG